MDPTLLSRVPGGPRDLVCLHIGGLPTTAVVSWPRGHVTSGGEVWELCESHPICVGQNYVQRETIHSKLRKREEYMQASLVFRN